jgi:hypothetical protein
MRHPGWSGRAASRLAPCLLVVVLLLGAGHARAEGPPPPAGGPPPRPLVGVQLRVLPFFFMFTFPESGMMAPSFGGLSVALEVQRRIVFEFGSSRVPWKGRHLDEAGADVFFRGGYAGTIREWRVPDGRGWILQWYALLGYRYLVLDIGNDASHDSWPHEGMALTGGLESRRYFSPRLAFSIRLLLGPSLLWRNDLVSDGMFEHPSGSSRASWSFDVGLDLGLVF